MEVLKHLLLFLPQLHPASYAYEKVFHYWCEYFNKKPTLIFLFKVHYGPMTQVRGKGLFFMVSIIISFHPLEGLCHNLHCRRIPFIWEMSIKINVIFIWEMSYTCLKGEYLSREELYFKKWSITFVKDLGYFWGVTPLDEVARKHLKCLIKSRLIVDAYVREEMKIIFGKS